MHIDEAMRKTRKQANSLRTVASGYGEPSYLGDAYREKAEALETVCDEVVRLRKELDAQRTRRIRQVFEHQ